MLKWTICLLLPWFYNLKCRNVDQMIFKHILMIWSDSGWLRRTPGHGELQQDLQPGVNLTTFFYSSLTSLKTKLGCLPKTFFHSSLILEFTSTRLTVEHLLTNIRLVWKSLLAINTPAYLTNVSVTMEKKVWNIDCSTVLSPSVLALDVRLDTPLDSPGSLSTWTSFPTPPEWPSLKLPD